MDWADVAAALTDAGGWAVVIVIGIAASTAFVKGWIVPGSVYMREITRADQATLAVANVTAALRELAEEVRWDARRDRAASRVGRDRHAAP